jgi:hypothetical protein
MIDRRQELKQFHERSAKEYETYLDSEALKGMPVKHRTIITDNCINRLEFHRQKVAEYS